MAEYVDEIRQGDMPQDLIEEIGARLHSHSTPLIRVRFKPEPHGEAREIGSGTLAIIDGVHGILTVQHVAEALYHDGDRLGLVLERGREQQSQVDLNHILAVSEGPWRGACKGPDLAFLALTRSDDVGMIEARRTFYNLAQHRDRVIDDPLPLNGGSWFLCGVAGEWTQPEESRTADFSSILHMRALCGAVGPTDEFAEGGYDYIDVEIEHEPGREVPGSFKGFSGGGLWQIPLGRDEDGSLEPLAYILSGAAICEFPIEDQLQTIRCHGRLSLYERLTATVQESAPLALS